MTYQELKHNRSYRWSSQERLLRRLALQYLGTGVETIELTGVIYPHYRGGLRQIAAMQEMARRGEPLLLVDGEGFVRGQWAITQIEEGQSFFPGNGQPLKQTFQLRLSRYGEDS